MSRKPSQGPPSESKSAACTPKSAGSVTSCCGKCRSQCPIYGLACKSRVQDNERQKTDNSQQVSRQKKEFRVREVNVQKRWVCWKSSTTRPHCKPFSHAPLTPPSGKLQAARPAIPNALFRAISLRRRGGCDNYGGGGGVQRRLSLSDFEVAYPRYDPPALPRK